MKCETLHGRIKYPPPDVPAISGNHIILWSVGSMPKINYIVKRAATGWDDVCGRLPWQWKTMGSLEGKKGGESGAYITTQQAQKNTRALDEKAQEREDRRRNRWGESETGNGGSERTQISAPAEVKKKGKTVDLQFFGELLAKIRRSRIKHYKMVSGAARGSGAGRMLWWQTPERRDYLLYCGITAWNKHEESSLVEASLNPPL